MWMIFCRELHCINCHSSDASESLALQQHQQRALPCPSRNPTHFNCPQTAPSLHFTDCNIHSRSTVLSQQQLNMNSSDKLTVCKLFKNHNSNTTQQRLCWHVYCIFHKSMYHFINALQMKESVSKCRCDMSQNPARHTPSWATVESMIHVSCILGSFNAHVYRIHCDTCRLTTTTWHIAVINFKQDQPTTVLRKLYRSTCVSWHLQLRTGGFCWCRVLLPACPCWRQPAHLD